MLRGNRGQNVFKLLIEGLIAHILSTQLCRGLIQQSLRPEGDLLRLHLIDFMALLGDDMQALGHEQRFGGHFMHFFLLIGVLGDKCIGIGQFFLSQRK